jgi:hypothetical protein
VITLLLTGPGGLNVADSAVSFTVIVAAAAVTKGNAVVVVVAFDAAGSDLGPDSVVVVVVDVVVELVDVVELDVEDVDVDGSVVVTVA